MIQGSHFFNGVIVFIISVILCFGKIHGQWLTNRTVSGGVSHGILQNIKNTTPWPALNNRHVFSTQSTVIQQPRWIQNGSNWIRNSPMTNQFTQVPNRNVNINVNIRVNSTSVMPPTSKTIPWYGSNGDPSFTDSSRRNHSNININFINNERSGLYNNITFTGSNHNKNRKTSSSGSVRDNMYENTNNANSYSQQSNEDISDEELRDFSEKLLAKDINNAAKLVTMNFQKMTTSRSTVDEAPLPLLNVNQSVFSIPTISKLIPLYNNYILETNQNEVYTAQEKIEENEFLDAILSTTVMQYTRNFLIEKGRLGKDPKEFKDLLRTLWFNMYSRGGGRIGSSGFEHVFLGELKNNDVSGLHNWIYFSEQEKNNVLNYLGYMKKLDLGDKGAILKLPFMFHNKKKPVGVIFIGTSPEVEIAVYTTCFVLRHDKICPLKMNGHRFIIRTYTFRYRGKNMIGSAFPEI